MLMREGRRVAWEVHENGWHRLCLDGDIRVLDAENLKSAMLQLPADAAGVVVDCKNVRSFDVAVLQVLLALKNSQSAQGKQFRMAGLGADAAKDVRLAGLAEYLDCCEVVPLA